MLRILFFAIEWVNHLGALNQAKKMKVHRLVVTQNQGTKKVFQLLNKLIVKVILHQLVDSPMQSLDKNLVNAKIIDRISLIIQSLIPLEMLLQIIMSQIPAHKCKQKI